MANLDDDLLQPQKSKAVPILIGVIVLLAAGFGGFMLFGQKGGKDGESGDAAADAPSEGPGPLHKIENLLVNLNDPSGDRYLKTSIVLELSGPEMAQEMVLRDALVRDRIISYLSSLRFAQTQGAKGKEQIRRGIKSQIEAQLKTGKLRGVYFIAFVVQ